MVSKTTGCGFESLLPCAATSASPLIVKIKSFLIDVKNELHKCSWPWEPKEKGMKKYRQLVDSTILVLVAMLLLGGFVSGCDFVMIQAFSFLTDLASR